MAARPHAAARVPRRPPGQDGAHLESVTRHNDRHDGRVGAGRVQCGHRQGCHFTDIDRADLSQSPKDRNHRAILPRQMGRRGLWRLLRRRRQRNRRIGQGGVAPRIARVCPSERGHELCSPGNAMSWAAWQVPHTYPSGCDADGAKNLVAQGLVNVRTTPTHETPTCALRRRPTDGTPEGVRTHPAYGAGSFCEAGHRASTAGRPDYQMLDAMQTIDAGRVAPSDFRSSRDSTAAPWLARDTSAEQDHGRRRWRR